MTSARSMFAAARAVAPALFLLVAGCTPTLVEPARIDASFLPRTMTIAVAPMRNESSVSVADGWMLGDAMQREAEQVVGLDAIPLERTARAMVALGIEEITTDAEARAVMRALRADGILVGTITAWDEYRPLRLGLAVALHLEDDHQGSGGLDPVALARTVGERPSPGAIGPVAPTAIASEIFDGSDHRTLKMLSSYADGRVEVDSAYGSAIYVTSMESFARFACHRMLVDLVSQEQVRREREAAAEAAAAAERERQK